MDCCAHCAATGELFGPKVAESDLRSYRKKGPKPTTRLILEELRRRPLEGAHLLDVGGGIGVLGLELLAAGFGGVVEVDASPAYLAVARRQFGERGWAERAVLLAGDFAALVTPPEPADVVTLDRVVCCYPDFESLLVRAAGCTRRLLALSYPRDRWYVRWAIALENLWRRITRNAFRSFVHPPARIAAVLERASLRRVARSGNATWVVELYARGDQSPPA
ncbi:MAG TPA: class I SAM-dependent methyltransferase [Candidatus Eisenbacteria bacterium]